MSASHEFAFFVPEFVLKVGNHLIADKDLYHRLITILRMQKGERGIFFNNIAYAFFVIEAITKKNFSVVVTELSDHRPLVPPLILLLPLLKREALEEAIYGAVESGVSEIQLVFTEKVKRSWQGQKEYERLIKMVHAAQEQGKYFSPILLHTPLSLVEALEKYHSLPLYFADPTGISVHSLSIKNCSSLLLVGPEGDLTEREKELLREKKAYFFSLTPTILRAQQAAIITVALFRSYSMS